MQTKNPSGYEEMAHTADWALRVWAPDLVELLRQSMQGMQKLMGIQVAAGGRQPKTLAHSALDGESLLVWFLNEILYWNLVERVACVELELTLDGLRLVGIARCAPIQSLTKEIKAVTFHNLSILKKDEFFETTIVFDV